MFLNSDTIKKRIITFHKEHNYFEDDGFIIKFEDITAFFHQEKMQMTNGVYEGVELTFTLELKEQIKPYIIKIDSKKEEKYKLIYTISNAISGYRTKKILGDLAQNQTTEFKTLNNFKLIFSNKGILEIVYIDRKSFAVKKAKMQKNLILFEGDDNYREVIYANTISDISLFLQLLSQQNYFIDESQKIILKEKKQYMVMMSLLGIFGLNGYFKFCCMENDIIEVVSSLSQIMLGVFILTFPFFWLAGQFNFKKMKEEIEYLIK